MESRTPLIVMKFHGVYSDVYPQPVMRRSAARELEGAFLNLLTEAGWKDDRVIEPEFSVNLSFSFTPFGIPVEKKQALDAHGKPTMGYLSHHIIADLEEDFHLLGKSTWNIEKEYAHKQALFAAANEAFGDILTVKYPHPRAFLRPGDGAGGTDGHGKHAAGAVRRAGTFRQGAGYADG